MSRTHMLLLGLSVLSTMTYGAFIKEELAQRVNYDYDCVADKEEDCLQNDVSMLGGKVVLVNMDDKCKLDR